MDGSLLVYPVCLALSWRKVRPLEDLSVLAAPSYPDAIPYESEHHAVCESSKHLAPRVVPEPYTRGGYGNGPRGDYERGNGPGPWTVR